MYGALELILFTTATVLYVVAWVWHLRSWQLGSEKQAKSAIRVLWAGWAVHVLLMGLRWLQVGHIPFITEFEFVPFFAMLVIGVFLLF